MGCMNIVIFLIQNQASPDEATVRGETPLHLAARANQTDIIRILLRNGAKVDARARVSSDLSWVGLSSTISLVSEASPKFNKLHQGKAYQVRF